ncbi:MAG TPA: glutamine--fructose-6-phosphate transaminase (isomerizing) [Bdellovibrionales bacterium]|nr:glutamine--fructose-6-phosphate transaminase (isomerizing) [Bdellovibrionales bacterium]
MCGIVGYLGPKNPKDVIMTGLKALEYRGYDSAGVAILDGGHFKRVRAEGKLVNLSEKLAGERFSGHLGIGHTRWATHGKPSERNAHPHCVGGVSLVHNGIIENYMELREELVAGGAVLESDTDSELVAHLLDAQLRKTPDLLAAVRAVLPRLIGAYAIVCVNEKQPDTMVAFKNGPPLIVGVGDDSMYVASDVQALVNYTKKIIYLEDGEVVEVKGKNYTVFSASGRETVKPIVEINWTADVASKGGFPHFMVKEIFEQPRAVAQAIQPHINLNKTAVELHELGLSAEFLADVERVFIVACGSSYYTGLVGEYLIERLARVPVECDIASEFRYRHPVLPKNSLFISISQSGETADTLAAVRLAKQSGVKVLSICNVRNSSIDREADGHLYMNAGTEVGVASTKAFSATLALKCLLALALAKAKGKLSALEESGYVRQILATPSQIETVLNLDKFFKEGASKLKSYKGFLYLGRGVHYPIAMEGALKLKELAYMHAEGYAAGEMKHGPLALIDKDMAIVMLAPHDDLFEKSVSNLEEAKARGGQVISISTGHNKRLEQISNYYLALPEADWFTLPLLEVIPVQLLAYHVAVSLGHDVDQPRNLAKSVTVE